MDHLVQRLVLLVAMLLVPSVLYAQGSITGTVRDTSGAVVPGVTVEASSPVLIEKVRSAVTDGTGQYRIVDLRPGTYTVTFTLTGFAPVRREGIELTGSFTATVSAELKVGSIEETVTVSGQSPMVDVQNTSQQRVLAKDIIDTLPSGRTAGTLAVLIPGVTGFSGTQDVGGTDSLGVNSQLTIHGSRTDDFRVMVDGFNSGGNGKGLKFNNNQPNVGSTEEVNIDIGGNAAEHASSGVMINFVPKEGGNQFAGSIFAAGAGSGMAGSNLTQRLKDAGLTTAASVKNTYDVNPAYGGPIRRDKLWFFAAARWIGYENYQGMYYNLNEGIKDAWTYVPDTSRAAYNKSYSRSGNGRLTWQITPKHKLSGYFDHQYKCECLQTGNSSFWARVGGYRVSPEAATEYVYTPSDTGTITWSSPLTSRVLLEAGVAYRREDYYTHSRPAAEDPRLNLIPVTDVGQNLIYHGWIPAGGPGGSYVLTSSSSFTPQARASLSYVAGAHAFKVGFHQQYLTGEETTSPEYNVGYTFFNGAPTSLEQRATPIPFNGSAPWDLGVYAQERWTVNRLTLDLGARFAHYANESPDVHFGPGPLVPTRDFTVPASKFYSLKDVTPSLGAAYDVFGTGRTAVKVALNKYLASPSALDGNPGNTLVAVATRSWTDGLSGTFALPPGDPRRGNFSADCDLTSTAANGECGPLSDANFGKPRPSTTIDPATYRAWGARGNNWEFLTSVQHELVPRVSVDVGYFRRVYANLLVTDNRALAPSDYDTFCITAPVDTRLPQGGGNQICGLYDLNPSKTVGGIPVDNYRTFADTYGKQYEHWNGVDVGVKARLSAVSLSGGLSSGRTSTDNCDVVTRLDNPSPLYCHVDTNFLTQVKAYGSYTIPKVEVQIAGTFQSIPGPQISAIYSVPSAEVAKTLGRPLSGGAALVRVNVVEPGTMYGERLNQIDLRIGKLFNLNRVRTAIYLDVYNALNVDTVLIENSSYTVWRQPLSIIRGRFGKVSARFDF